MIAYRRVDVLDLNGRARELMRAAGALGATELRLPGGSFAVGDRVLLRRNELRLGVSNGDRGIVLAVDPAARALDIDVGDRRVRLGGAYLERATPRSGPSLVHGYAITGHSAQGMTCREAFVLAIGPVSREWGYTALSRGSEANRLYAVARESDERSEYAPTEARPVDPHQSLVAAFSRSAAQTLASDIVREAQPQRELVATVGAREVAERSYWQAVRDRSELERGQPHRLRFHACQVHREALATAREVEAAAERRLNALRTSEVQLLDRVRRSRATRDQGLDRDNIERVRVATRTHAHDRGLELGL